MSAGSFDLTIEQYTTFTLDLTITEGEGDNVTPMDLTPYTPRLQVRESAAAREILLACNPENGRILVDQPTSGVIQITLTAEDTSHLSWSEGVYDLLLTGPDTHRLLEGSVTVRPGVTR